jgi:hypothetical protein
MVPLKRQTAPDFRGWTVTVSALGLFSLYGDHCFRLRSGTDFVDGAVTIAANGSPAAQAGLEF